mgnify:CR=1 FL=1
MVLEHPFLQVDGVLIWTATFSCFFVFGDVDPLLLPESEETLYIFLGFVPGFTVLWRSFFSAYNFSFRAYD